MAEQHRAKQPPPAPAASAGPQMGMVIGGPHGVMQGGYPPPNMQGGFGVPVPGYGGGGGLRR